MGLLSNCQTWNWPTIGKFILIVITLLEASINLYLLLSNQGKSKATALSAYLLATSFVMLVNIGLSISIRFYYYYPTTFHVLALFSIVSRTTAIIMIVKLNNEVSDQIFITEEGYLKLFRNAIVFILMQIALIY